MQITGDLFISLLLINNGNYHEMTKEICIVAAMILSHLIMCHMHIFNMSRHAEPCGLVTFRHKMTW